MAYVLMALVFLAPVFALALVIVVMQLRSRNRELAAMRQKYAPILDVDEAAERAREQHSLVLVADERVLNDKKSYIFHSL